MFFKNFIKFLKKFFLGIEDSYEEIDLNQALSEHCVDLESNEKINVQSRTLLSKLYSIEQDITFFEKTFPEKYREFLNKINELREDYNKSLRDMKSNLTFEIDPDLDYSRIGEIMKLENDVRRFIETEVKFDIISKRLQRIIRKLNILYNVSISHPNEKQKVLKQLEFALSAEARILKELKECYYILSDVRQKDRIVNLVSYIDYYIFKTKNRNSETSPFELLNTLSVTNDFEGLNYLNIFRDFIKDEISDWNELIPLINDDTCRSMIERQSMELYSRITYSSEDDIITKCEFWNDFFNLENKLIELLKSSGVNDDKANIKILSKMNISVEESDVLVSCKVNAYLSLTSIYAKTHNEKVLVAIKFLRSLSDDVTYRELYFIFILFDVLPVLLSVPNDLVEFFKKYIEQYPYSKSSMDLKKEQVMKSYKKEYVIAFSVADYEKAIIGTLKDLNIDYLIDGNNVLINAFYFQGLPNILNNLTKKI